MIGVAVVVRVVGGVRVACGLLVSAGHLVIPFRWFNYSTEIVTNQPLFLLQFCYKWRPAEQSAGAKKSGCLVTRSRLFAYPLAGSSSFFPNRVPPFALILPASGFQALPCCCLHIYIPQSRTSACGGFIGNGLTDSHGSHPLRLRHPSTCTPIIADRILLVKGFEKLFSFSRLSTWPSWFCVLPLQHHREFFGERRSFLPAQV